VKLTPEAFRKLPPEKQNAVKALLEEQDRAKQQNPVLWFKPHSPAQHNFLAAKTPIQAAFCGNQFGKTCAGVIKAYVQHLPNSVLPQHLQEYKRVTHDLPVVGWLDCPSAPVMESVIKPELRKWAPRDFLLGNVRQSVRQAEPRPEVQRRGKTPPLLLRNGRGQTRRCPGRLHHFRRTTAPGSLERSRTAYMGSSGLPNPRPDPGQHGRRRDRVALPRHLQRARRPRHNRHQRVFRRQPAHPPRRTRADEAQARRRPDAPGAVCTASSSTSVELSTKAGSTGS
jgi:hypothetical protein